MGFNRNGGTVGGLLFLFVWFISTAASIGIFVLICMALWKYINS